MTDGLGAAEDTPAAATVVDALHRLCLADLVWAERYRGWEELGRGGSARVVRVFSRSAGEDVALKVFLHLSEDDVRRFQREVHNAQRLASPCVVRTFSPFLRDGFAWIEMELVDGPNLRHELERRQAEGTPFSLAEMLEIASCIVRAVESAHEHGVIHRDIKPANVLLPGGGAPRAKLGDFGVSRLAESTRATATGLLPGTPQFVAPEVIDGRAADAASDVYSLCLTLHLLFSNGRHALPVPAGATPAQWLRAQGVEPPIAIRQHDSSLPEALESLLLQGLAKDPACRPSAAEVLARLVALESPGRAPTLALARAASPARAALIVSVAGGVLIGAFAGARWSAGVGEERAPAVSASPPPAATPAAPAPANPTPAPELRVRVSAIAADRVSFENGGEGVLHAVRVDLVGESGARCSAGLDRLGEGEDVTLGFGAFEPPPGDAFRVRAIEISARTSSGLRTLAVNAERRQ